MQFYSFNEKANNLL